MRKPNQPSSRSNKASSRDADSVLAGRTEPIEELLLSEKGDGEPLDPIALEQEFLRLVLDDQIRFYTLAYSLLGNQQNAEDVVQDALVKAYIALKVRAIYQMNMRTWLSTIIRNTAYNYHTREGRSTPLDLSEDSELSQREGNRFEEPEIVLSYNESRSEIFTCINQLPHHYGIIIKLRFFYDLSYQDIAVVLNRPVGTIKCYINRGLSLLRKNKDIEAIKTLIAE